MPEDNQFECTIVGNGTQTQFQLYKQIYTSRIPIQHTLATESEDPLMWSNPNNEMWSIPSAQMWNLQFTITSNGLLQLSIPLLEGESITVTGTFTIVVVLLMMNSNIPILCLSSGKLEKST